MRLEALDSRYALKNDDSGLDTTLRQILDPFKESMARVAMHYFNKVSGSPHNTVVSAHRTIDQLVNVAGPQSKLSVLARRQYPESYEKGMTLMDKISSSLAEAIEEFVGDPRRISEDIDWIKTQKLSIETYIMIESIASPLIKTASAVDVTQVTSKAAFMVGILDWFTGIRELIGDQSKV